MEYRYKKFQLFAKSLDVPKNIKNAIYNNNLTLQAYIEYELNGKIPVSCLIERDQQLLEKFGFEKLRTLDFELIRHSFMYRPLNLFDELLKLDYIPDNINHPLYDLVGDKLYLDSYTPGMREYFKHRFFGDDEITEENRVWVLEYMNGRIHIADIIRHWELFKYKDLDYVLMHDYYNEEFNLRTEDLHNFVNNYGGLIGLVLDRMSVYKFISEVTSKEKTEEEVHEYIKKFVENVVLYSKSNQTELTNEEYREIFKYIDMKEYLDEIYYYSGDKIVDELSKLDPNYLYNLHIPIAVLFNRDIIKAVSYFGIQPIVEFDKECGGLLSRNNYSLLSCMFEYYIHYGGNVHDPEKMIDTREKYDEDGNYIGQRAFTKYEFFEAMKRMLKYGPTNGEFREDAPNFSYITGEFRDIYPELFVSDDLPQEFRDLFYTRDLVAKHIHDNPEYGEYLRGKDLTVSFKTRWISIDGFYHYYLYEYLVDRFGHDEMIKFVSEYHAILDLLYEDNLNFRLDNFKYNNKLSEKCTLDDIKKYFNKMLIYAIEYQDSIIPSEVPTDTRVMYPNLFLDDDVPEDIKDSYYNRKFNYEFIQEHPDILKYFNNTNIAYGFNKDFKWLINIKFNSGIKQANQDILKVLDFYGKIQDKDLQDTFAEFVKDNVDIALSNLEITSKLLQRLSFSNSVEVFNFRTELAKQLLNVENPLESLDKVERLFIKNDLPTYAKLFGVFNILHPGFYGFNLGEGSYVSPVLKNAKVNEREEIVRTDLLKSAMLSNNKSLNNFLDVIEMGDAILSDGVINDDNIYIATKFRDCLVSLLEMYGKTYTVTEDVLSDLNGLKQVLSKDENMDYAIKDRVIEMISGKLGFTTMDEFRSYIKDSLELRDKEARERISSYSGLKIEEGDFVKGIGDLKYLKNILQNGSVSKEYLGASASSDGTPLDTDLSKITTNYYGIKENITAAGAGSYGNIYFVLKNRDGRFNVTRDHDGSGDIPNSDDKLEVFYTGVVNTDNSRHYGIRTGFASSEIDFIVLKEVNPAVFLEIAMNGFYIPVVDFDGKLVFSPKDYDILRGKMSGLSYYGTGEYEFSDSLVIPDTEEIASLVEKSELETKYKREKILDCIKSVLDEMGIKLKTYIDGDLTEGSVELIDTGSTGRGTNKPGDGDFDFMMRVDRVLLQDALKFSEFKSKLLNAFNGNNSQVIGTGDFRLKDVVLDDIIVDIDITFTEKTDKITYSTDMALQDRLTNIKLSDPEKYKYVVANILLAKNVLKEAGCYKPNRGEVPQGGLGGVGIENWILQNGGSFMDACDSFLRVAQGKSFSEFKECYQVFDFGENHLAQRKGHYVHDNFVFNNMSEEGYLKMRDALNAYVYEVNYGNKKTSSLN